MQLRPYPVSFDGSGGGSHLGSKLSVLAKNKGLTQERIAKECNISRVSINRFFRGKSDLRTHDLLRLLAVLDIHLENEIDLAFLENGGGRQRALSSEERTLYRDLIFILNSLSPLIQATLLEQICWWGRAQSEEVDPLSTSRTAQYIEKLRRQGVG